MNIKKNDKVLVIKGKDRGKSGKVEKVFPKLGRVIVSSVNKYKKHVKPNQKNTHGGIIDINTPIYRANVCLICSKCEKATKITYTIINKRKFRICKKCGESVDTV